VFLLVNGLELDAPEPEAVLVIRDVAAGEMGEPELVAWLRDRSSEP
jgi:prophage maintenance system killer protein